MANTGDALNNILYVSNFQRSTTEEELKKLFGEFGKINSLIKIPKSDFAFGFVEFDDIRDAIDAQRELNRSYFRGRNLNVEYKNIKSGHENSSSSNNITEIGDENKSKE